MFPAMQHFPLMSTSLHAILGTRTLNIVCISHSNTFTWVPTRQSNGLWTTLDSQILEIRSFHHVFIDSTSDRVMIIDVVVHDNENVCILP